MSADAWYGWPTAHVRSDCQFMPPSYETSTEPSFPYMTWLLLFGSIQMAWWSTWPRLSSSRQVLAPSVDLYPWTPATNTVFSLFGSTRSWLKYMGRAFWLLWNVHVLPPSAERQTPDVAGSGG